MFVSVCLSLCVVCVGTYLKFVLVFVSECVCLQGCDQCWVSDSKKVISYLLVVTSVNCNKITLLVAAFEK